MQAQPKTGYSVRSFGNVEAMKWGGTHRSTAPSAFVSIWGTGRVYLRRWTEYSAVTASSMARLRALIARRGSVWLVSAWNDSDVTYTVEVG